MGRPGCARQDRCASADGRTAAVERSDAARVSVGNAVPERTQGRDAGRDQCRGPILDEHTMDRPLRVDPLRNRPVMVGLERSARNRKLVPHSGCTGGRGSSPSAAWRTRVEVWRCCRCSSPRRRPEPSGCVSSKTRRTARRSGRRGNRRTPSRGWSSGGSSGWAEWRASASAARATSSLQAVGHRGTGSTTWRARVSRSWSRGAGSLSRASVPASTPRAATPRTRSLGPSWSSTTSWRRLYRAGSGCATQSERLLSHSWACISQMNGLLES